METLRGIERKLEGVDRQIVDRRACGCDMPASGHRTRLWADPVAVPWQRW